MHARAHDLYGVKNRGIVTAVSIRVTGTNTVSTRRANNCFRRIKKKIRNPNIEMQHARLQCRVDRFTDDAIVDG